jgi:hypothetical protein
MRLVGGNARTAGEAGVDDPKRQSHDGPEIVSVSLNGEVLEEETQFRSLVA